MTWNRLSLWASLLASLLVLLGVLPLTSWAQSEFVALEAPAVAASAASAASAAPGVELEQGEPPTMGEAAVPGPPPVAGKPKVRAGAPARSPMARPERRARQARVATTPPVSDAHTEHVVFRRKPITVMLPLKRERLLSFPAPVQLDLPASVMSALKVSSVGRTTYLYASKPIPKTRVMAQELEGARRVFLVDLITAADASVMADELEIHGPDEERSASEGQPASKGADANEIDMVQLTRFAAQTVYAPTRLLPSVTGIAQTPVSLTPLPGLIRAARVMAAPIGAWRAGALTVTAVKLTNVSSAPLALNLDELRGKWVAASSQHPDLGPAGSSADTSVLYLICEGPFEACR
jgi:integrating conjugative element protein (TIGR03749 family)